ncbi:MAG TPA: hypothetical protein VGF17_22140, partial [Phytomonospora sp.]
DIARLGPDAVERATTKYLNRRRLQGRIPDDADWVTWLANEFDDEQPDDEPTWTPASYRDRIAELDAAARSPHLHVVPDPAPPLAADEAQADARAAIRAAKDATRYPA